MIESGMKKVDKDKMGELIEIGAEDYITAQVNIFKKYSRDLQESIRTLTRSIALSGRLGKKVTEGFLLNGIRKYGGKAKETYENTVKKYGKRITDVAIDSAKRLVRSSGEEFEGLKQGFYQLQTA